MTLLTICRELKLEDLVIPSRATGLHLADLAENRDLSDVSSYLKNEARLFRFVADKKDSGTIPDLNLPEKCHLICCYRDGKFLLIEEDEEIREGDEVVLITHSENLQELRDRWKSDGSESSDDED